MKVSTRAVLKHKTHIEMAYEPPCEMLPAWELKSSSIWLPEKKHHIFPIFLQDPKLIWLQNSKGKKFPRRDRLKNTNSSIVLLQLRVFELLKVSCWLVFKSDKKGTALGQPSCCWDIGGGRAEHPRNWKWSPMSACGHRRYWHVNPTCPNKPMD